MRKIRIRLSAGALGLGDPQDDEPYDVDAALDALRRFAEERFPEGVEFEELSASPVSGDSIAEIDGDAKAGGQFVSDFWEAYYDIDSDHLLAEVEMIPLTRKEAAAVVRACWTVVNQEGTMPPRPAEVMLVSAIDKLTRAFGLDKG